MNGRIFKPGDRVLVDGQEGEITKTGYGKAEPSMLVYFGAYMAGRSMETEIRVERWVAVKDVELSAGTIRAGTPEWDERQRAT